MLHYTFKGRNWSMLVVSDIFLECKYANDVLSSAFFWSSLLQVSGPSDRCSVLWLAGRMFPTVGCWWGASSSLRHGKWLMPAVARRKLTPSNSVSRHWSSIGSSGEVNHSLAYTPSCRMVIVKPRICTTLPMLTTHRETAVRSSEFCAYHHGFIEFRNKACRVSSRWNWVSPSHIFRSLRGRQEGLRSGQTAASCESCLGVVCVYIPYLV